jgi:soluble lytic murein transglycosylase-like protein
MLPLLLLLIPLYVQDGYNPPPDPVILFIGEAPEAVTTTTSPAPVEQAAGSGLGNRGSDVDQWLPLVAGHFNPEDVQRVLCLIGHESGGNETARNSSSGASGLLQVMPFWADEYGLARSGLFKAEINLWVGRKIRDSQGWTAWAPYNRGLCRG